MLVAVIVPNEENTMKWAESKGHTGQLSELCLLDQLREHILVDLKAIAQREKVLFFSLVL